MKSFTFFAEAKSYEDVTEKDASDLLESITAPWFERVRDQVPALFPAP